MNAVTAGTPDRIGSNRLVERYVRLRAYIVMGLLLAALLLMVGLIWRNLSRFETVRSYVEYSHLVQQANFDLQRVLAEHFSSPDGTPDPRRIERLSHELDVLAHHEGHADPDTPERLAAARDHVRLAERSRTREARELAFLQALDANSAMLDAETLQRESLLEDIATATRTEVALAAGLLVTLLVVGMLFLRARVWRPLLELRGLLTRLAQEDYSPIATRQLDPILQTVFDSYNDMVIRLAELEEAKRSHAASLEAEVRAATSALLEQHAVLARAERLAALGELSASIAHELRNPLAGILLTCTNLHEDLQSSDQVLRLDLVIAELRRMSQLLNQLLGQARHVPEPDTDCDLTPLIQEIVALTRYQVPRSMTLEIDAESGLTARIPASRLRQALLNLILNAAAALGQSGGTTRIATRAIGKKIRLTVTDNGPGFPRELLANGVRPFATGRAEEGTGLGLVMVRRFLQDIGGKFSIENVDPHGARVTLDLPSRSET